MLNPPKTLLLFSKIVVSYLRSITYNGMYGLIRTFFRIINKAYLVEFILLSISYDRLICSSISFNIVLAWAIRKSRNEVKNIRRPLTSYNDLKLPLSE